MRRSVVSPRQDEDARAALDVAAIRAATAELHLMCVAAAGRIVRDRRYAELGLDARTADLVERSWNRRDPALLGRLDLALGIDGVPRLVGYGADVPARLLESLDEAPALRDQLIARWRELRPRLGARIHFAHEDGEEATLGFLRATAEAAGLASTAIELAELRWDRGRRALVDREGVPVHAVVKASTWERLLATPLAPVLADAPALWLEPAWKVVLANRAFLPILRHLFPDHPNLLPAREPAGDVIQAWVIGDALAGIRWPVSAAAP